MKKALFYFTAIAGLCACSVDRDDRLYSELAQGCETDLTVSVDESTKVDINDSDTQSSLSWNASDKLVLISQDGAQTEVYSIKQYGEKSCVFSGNKMNSTTVTMILPGSKYTTVSSLEQRNYSSQQQDGNGSLAHLEYNAWLKNVSNYANVTFSQAWASAHGGTCFQNGCIKLSLDLPKSMVGHQVTIVSLKTDRATFKTTLKGSKGTTLNLGLKNVTVGQDARLTAYLMFPADNIAFENGQSLTLSLLVDQKYYLEKTIGMSGKTLLTGKMNVLAVNSDNWSLKDMLTNLPVTPKITIDGVAGKDEWTLPHPDITVLSLPENAYFQDFYNAYVYADKGWVLIKMEFYMPSWNYSLPFDLMIDIDGNPATGATVSASDKNGDGKLLWSNMGVEWYLETLGLSNMTNAFYDWTSDEVTGQNRMAWYKYMGSDGQDIWSGGLTRMYYSGEVPNQLSDRHVKAVGSLDQSKQRAVLEVRLRRFTLEARSTVASKMRVGFKYMSADKTGEESGFFLYGLLPQGPRTDGPRQLVDMAEVYLPAYEDYEWND